MARVLQMIVHDIPPVGEQATIEDLRLVIDTAKSLLVVADTKHPRLETAVRRLVASVDRAEKHTRREPELG